MRQESNLQGRGSPGFRPGSVARSDCASLMRRGRESNSQGRSSTAFGAGPVADRVASPWWRKEYSKPTHKEPLAFQTVTAPWRLHPPRRRADDSNATAEAAHSLAARPGTLAGSLSRSGGRGQASRPVRADRCGRDLPASLRAPPRIRTGNLRSLSAATLPVGLEGHGVTDRIRTGPLTLARSDANR